MWTFGRRIAAGFAIAFAMFAIIGFSAYRNIDVLTKTSYLVAHTHLVTRNIFELLGQLVDAEASQRGFLITGDETFLEPYRSATAALPQLMKNLRELTADDQGQQKRINDAQSMVAAKLTWLKRTIDMRRSGGFEPAMKLISTREGERTMDDLRRVLDEMDANEQQSLKLRADDVESARLTATWTIVTGTLIALVFISAVGWFLTQTLSQQIGSAVGHVRTSSAELQAAATQQATGSREQSTATSEISTTISELLATSRQINESAQRVAHSADLTAVAARAGDETVETAHESIAGIRRQVDLVVSHMLELGKTSQQIGGVLEIVSEMAEQTNILAINATIEAAGAGEAGKRFAVVADEIRKLADRVAGSTKEIRGLVDDVRSAVNTTVMATETGSKAVDAGSKQFGHVAASFKQIADLVVSTTEAAREIELSTKQQMTAVEQVNVAIRNVAQASKETEASAGQTQQTASQLSVLSRDLLRLVQPSVA
jgi:CHASE3 domain sensor protein